MNRISTKFVSLVAVIFALLAPAAAQAATTLSIAPAPVTWNIVGLDSNSPATGPHLFPVGTRVCSSVATTNVSVSFSFDTANALVNLRAGSLSAVVIPSIGAGQCKDAYFEVDVTQTAAAFDTTRRYHITATDGSGSVSTVTPRELYVEHLISQNRNSVTDVKFGPVGCGAGNTCTSVAPGGSMNLVVGDSYDIQIFGGTATQGYNQFEDFINFPNTIFQIQSVNTTYSADNSPFVPNPNDKLYADACLWENDPNSPVYRACTGGDFKAGGNNVVTTYSIKIISGGGTSQTLGSLLYDFSGSSYHYNSDFGFGARIANIIDPTSATVTISKSFSPNPAPLNGISALTVTLTNSNGGTLGGYNFVDNLPANLVVATPNGATTSGCGAPTLTATAGSSSISFSNGTLAANSNCIIKVNVTPTATGSLVNTTNHLFIDTVDTGHNATATLTVNNAPPPGTGFCGVTLANWSVPNGTTANPPDLTGGVPTVKAANVATATLAANVPGSTSINTTSGHVDTTSWSTFGYKNAGQFIQFTIDTSQYTGVHMSFWVANPSPANGPAQITVTADAGAGFGAPVLTINAPAAAFTQHTIDFTGLTNTGGNTVFRITATGANNDASGASLLYDDMVFTGCTNAIMPTISKAFAPNPIAVNGVSTLTFTLTNTNPAPLTGAAFNDALPGGVQVAATPAAATTCGGTWTPAAGNTTLTFSGGTIPASGSCTVSVNVTATTSGPHSNTSGFLSTTESGTNTTSIASASLSAVLPPSIAKEFAPSPVLQNAPSTLTFTITNPNQNDALSGVAFGDTFPTSPGAMVVAGTPNAATTGCGSPVFSPVAGAGSITFSGGTIAGGGTCTVSLSITAPATGTYNNTSGPVSYVINAQTINGNTASGSLVVNPPNPSIHLLKQVGASNAGPWEPFLAVATGGNVFYQFTVENTGDVPLTLGPTTITDNNVNVSTCNAGFNGTVLPVAVAANNNHIVTCVVGPVTAVSGSHTNTASVTATFNSAPITSPNSSATYATTGLTLAKSATETTFTNPGEVLHYSYLVTNSGFAPLQGPVTVADNKTTVTCPPVNTVGDLDNFLDPGESITCTATYTITGADVTNAQVTNTATATVQGVNSNSSSKTVPLSTSADVSIDKTLTTSGPYNAGQTINYTLTVANAGPSTATNIQVTDTPSNMTITNVSGSGCAALPCTIASLGSGANTQIFVTATINAAGAFDNSATAQGAQPDPNPSNNTDNTGNGGTAVSSADMQITKTLDTAGPFRTGDTVSYTLTVTNNGPSTATNIQINDTPSNITITSVSGSGCSAMPCTIASLGSTNFTVLNVTGTINAPGSFSNSATVSADQTDPVPGNNTDSSGGTATTSADVSIAKAITTAGPYFVGETITYTLTVNNAGPSVATNVVVNDTPTNMTIQTVSGPSQNTTPCSTFPCTMIPAMAINDPHVITVTATITATGDFSNTATANGDDFDPNSSNNSSTAGGTTSPSADLAVVKTFVTQGPFRNGDVITFNIAVTNNGPDTATNVVVRDHPVGLSVLTMSGGGCTGASVPGSHNQNVQCTIASLANGATANVTVTASIDNPGQFTNDGVIVSEDQIDPVTTNNDSQVVDVATTSADVSIVKAITTAGPYHIGDTITYTLTVHNAGPSPASFVVVNDTPTNMTIQTVSGANCSSLPCTMSNPPVMVIGNTRVITVTATITAVGAFSNTATANGNDFDPNTANNTSTAGGTAVAAADVSLVKTLVTSGPFTVGEAISYTIVVANAGPSTATNVVVTDTPTNLTITNVSGGGCSALPCTIASLASGANVTINVNATINAASAFDNSATATATEFDPNTSNNTDNTGNGGTAGPSADLSLVKTLVTSGPFTVGEAISYTIVVANAGPSTATNVVVTDTPTNLTITNVSGGGCSALPCTIASLASGANVTINVTATIKAAGSFDNSATATATEFDPNTANNTDNTGNGGTAGVSADLSLVKTLVTAGPFTAGQTISYTIVVANAGPSTATNVHVTDTPTNLTITNVSGGGCSALPCTIASLASGANVTINVNATINAAGTFDNSATVSATEPDPNPSNNTDNTGNGGTATAASIDLAIAKTAPATPIVVNAPFDYTLAVTNHGPGTATGVVVTDPLPANFTLISANATQGSCSGTTTVTCNLGTILNGGSATVTIHGTASTAGPLSNTATVTANETDTAPANNSSTAAVTVVEDVPALSGFALMLLAVSLAIAAAMVLRHRG